MPKSAKSGGGAQSFNDGLEDLNPAHREENEEFIYSAFGVLLALSFVGMIIYIILYIRDHPVDSLGNSEMVFRKRFHVGKRRESHHQSLLEEIWPDGAKSDFYNLSSGKRRPSRFQFSKPWTKESI